MPAIFFSDAHYNKYTTQIHCNYALPKAVSSNTSGVDSTLWETPLWGAEPWRFHCHMGPSPSDFRAWEEIRSHPSQWKYWGSHSKALGILYFWFGMKHSRVRAFLLKQRPKGRLGGKKGGLLASKNSQWLREIWKERAISWSKIRWQETRGAGGNPGGKCGCSKKQH